MPQQHQNADAGSTIKELLLQALETEMGGIDVYKTAIACTENEDLRDEWQEYLEQTQTHVEIVRDLFEVFELDPEERSPGREIVHDLGQSLVKAMEKAKRSGQPEMAQIVAAECVVIAETKDHQNWEILGEFAETLDGREQDALLDAYEDVMEEENEHLYHTKGWARELWMQHLGMAAVLPPPEEQEDVHGAIEAEHAKSQRAEMG